MKKICVFASNGLGDGVLSLVLARNLQNLGHQVTLFSSPMVSLQAWIPWVEIHPFISAEEIETALEGFDRVLAVEHSKAIKKGEGIYLSRSQTVVQTFESYLKEKWGPIKTVGPEDLRISLHYQDKKHPIPWVKDSCNPD